MVYLNGGISLGKKEVLIYPKTHMGFEALRSERRQTEDHLLYQMPQIGYFVETDLGRQLGVLGRAEWAVATAGPRTFSAGDENVLEREASDSCRSPANGAPETGEFYRAKGALALLLSGNHVSL